MMRPTANGHALEYSEGPRFFLPGDTRQLALELIPLVNRFQWNNRDFTWSVEACITRSCWHARGGPIG